MLKLTDETVIQATPDVIFDVITDFDSYARWNPWVIEARATKPGGGANVGDELDVKAKLGDKIQKVRHRILVNRRGVELKWCDLGLFTLFAYGERSRVLEPLASGGVAYRVELRITGIASRLVEALYGKILREGLRGETNALKQRAEAVQRQAA
jgi:ribosome-associated toxin RatA of RatAB toxin-antitoxin module